MRTLPNAAGFFIAQSTPQPRQTSHETSIITALPLRSIMQKRTHSCGALRDSHVGQTVSLAGWVNKYRDHGGVVFIDLRDRDGLTQIVFHPENAEAHKVAATLRNEDVVSIQGKCVAREAGMTNAKLPTGKIEIQA